MRTNLIRIGLSILLCAANINTAYGLGENVYLDQLPTGLNADEICILLSNVVLRDGNYLLLDYSTCLSIDQGGYTYLNESLGEASIGVFSDEVLKYNKDGSIKQHLCRFKVNDVAFSNLNNDQREELHNAVELLVSQAKSEHPEDKTKQLRYIYNYLVRNVAYHADESDLYIRDAYGALVRHKAVCVGYAQAVYLLCNSLEIPNIICSDLGDMGDGHQWNLVRVDGAWKYVDATWGHTTGRYDEYFLTDTVVSSYKESFDEKHYKHLAQLRYMDVVDEQYDFLNELSNGLLGQYFDKDELGEYATYHDLDILRELVGMDDDNIKSDPGNQYVKRNTREEESLIQAGILDSNRRIELSQREYYTLADMIDMLYRRNKLRDLCENSLL